MTTLDQQFEALLNGKQAIKTVDGFEVEPDSGDDLYFALLHMAGGTWQAVGPFATLDAAAGRIDEDLDEYVVKAQFVAPGRTAARKQAERTDGSPDKCAFCDKEPTVVAEWHDRSGLHHVVTKYLCEDHRHAATNWSGQVSIKNARKQAQGDNPYGGGDRANPYFDPAPSQQTGPSYVPAPEEVTRPVTTRPRGGGDAGPDIEDQDTFTEDGQGFDMTQDRTEQGSADQGGTMGSLDSKVAVRCADCGQHGKLALSKANDDLACRCGSTNVDLDDLVPDPDHLAVNAIARDIRKANPDLPRERVRTMAKRAHGLSKGAAWELVSAPKNEGDDLRFEWGIGKYRLVAEGREGRKYDDTWTWRIEERGTAPDVHSPEPYTTIVEGTANGETEAMRKAEEAFDFDDTAPKGS